MIKWLAAAAIVASLQGCMAMAFLQSHAQSFWQARWDPHESKLIAEVVVQTHDLIKICQTDSSAQQADAINQLVQAADHLNAYSRTLPDDNSAMVTVSKNIKDSSQEFYQRAQNRMSRVYCENKVVNLQAMAEQAQRVAQAKRK